MMQLRCARCRREYSVSADKPQSGRVYICQDCAERELAKIQKRRPRLIYDKDGYATVTGGCNEQDKE